MELAWFNAGRACWRQTPLMKWCERPRRKGCAVAASRRAWGVVECVQGRRLVARVISSVAALEGRGGRADLWLPRRCRSPCPRPVRDGQGPGGGEREGEAGIKGVEGLTSGGAVRPARAAGRGDSAV